MWNCGQQWQKMHVHGKSGDLIEYEDIDMSKHEFLEKLQLALSGRVPAATVTENVRYYEDYINIEIRKGRSEE